jgi:EAL domain-containing protein (putative c-di-GMP-specific phosphodiesterase class I)
MAMYLAKGRGGNQVAPFERDLRPQTVRRLELEQGLAYCLQRDELILHYQPILRVSDRSLVGAEALLRWKRPGHDLVGPDEFIPLLEQTGFIVPVGAWVLGGAMGQLRKWKDAGLVPVGFTMSINLSPRQFLDSSLAATISQLITANGLSPSEITVEITETAAMSDSPETVAAVREIAGLGVGLSIDDFGTGYSSLSMLAALPVTELKIDKQFIGGLVDGRQNGSLAAVVLDLAQRFELNCVAEGVEQEAQLEQLRAMGCEFAQGFHLGMPVEAPAFFASAPIDSAVQP